MHIHDENDFLAGFPLLEPDRGEFSALLSSLFSFSLLSFFSVVLSFIFGVSLTYPDPGVLDVAWAVIHRDMLLAFSHLQLVEKVARRLNSYW